MHIFFEFLRLLNPILSSLVPSLSFQSSESFVGRTSNIGACDPVNQMAHPKMYHTYYIYVGFVYIYI